MSTSSSRFDIADAFGVGWRTFVANVVPMALYALAVFAVSVIVNLILGQPTGFFASLFSTILMFVIGQLMAIGWLRIALDAIDGRPVSADRIRESFGVLVPYLIGAIIFGIAVSIGMVLLIVPGIIVILVFGFYGWIIVDGVRKDAIEALRRSAEITRGERLHLFVFGILLMLFNILGLIVLVVGVLVTSAISVLAVAHVYRQLEASAAGARRPAPEEAPVS